MKNKLKWVVSLAILLTLALLAFTGCERENRKYDLKQHSLYGRLPEAAQAENSGALKRHQNETAGMAPAL